MRPAIFREGRWRGCFKMGQKEKRPLGLRVRTCAQTQAASEQRCQLGVIKHPKTKSPNTSNKLSNTPKPNYQIPQNRIIKYPKTKLSNTQNNHQIPKTIIRYQYVAVSILQSHIQYKVSYQRVVFSFMHGPLHWRNDFSCKSSSRWGIIGALLRLNTIIL